MKPDPRFPDRPTHADFDVLSAVVIENDRRSEAGEFDALMAETVDADSITYMVTRRALMLGARHAADVARLGAAMMDSFMLGVGYANAKRASGDLVFDAEIGAWVTTDIYVWPAPTGDGWVDAWNGWYATEAEARENAAAGVGRPWVLRYGENIITADELEARINEGSK